MDMELCYAVTSEGPPTYREGGFPSKPPFIIWWRVTSMTHIVEDVFMFFFSTLLNVHGLFVYSCSLL